MVKSINGNLSEKQLTLEKELRLEGAFDRDLELGKKKVAFNRPIRKKEKQGL